MTTPTAAEFKARHPRFDAVGDALVDIYLAEAALSCPDSWGADQAAGIMYLAAHLMSEEGALDPTNAAPGTGARVKKVKAGEVETEFAQDGEGYNSTVYGRRFAELQRKNAGGNALILVV